MGRKGAAGAEQVGSGGRGSGEGGGANTAGAGSSEDLRGAAGATPRAGGPLCARPPAL